MGTGHFLCTCPAPSSCFLPQGRLYTRQPHLCLCGQQAVAAGQALGWSRATPLLYPSLTALVINSTQSASGNSQLCPGNREGSLGFCRSCGQVPQDSGAVLHRLLSLAARILAAPPTAAGYLGTQTAQPHEWSVSHGDSAAVKKLAEKQDRAVCPTRLPASSLKSAPPWSAGG